MYVGMDIHKDNHTACAINCFGQNLLGVEIENNGKDFVKLIERVERLSKQKNLKPIFALEDSYGNGYEIAEFLDKQGYKIKMVSPVTVDRKRRYETHPEKSDFLDAFGIAKVLIEKIDILPNYSITQEDKLAKEIKELADDRDFLVKEQTRLKNQLHAILHKSYGSDYKKIFKDIFALKALKYWQRHPFKKRSMRFVSFGDNDVLQNQIKRKVKRLICIKEELKEINKDLETLVKQTGQKLETMNGCGTILAAKILGEVRNIDRFHSPYSLAKYAGLSPREKSSGKKTKHIKTLSGNRRLNRAIHQVALSQIGRNGNIYAKEYFQKKVSEGKTKVQALCCLKRKLIDIIYMMLKYKQEYNYHREAKQSCG